jgi:flagellar biosynthesis/type III secretory pathway protein FliH
LEATELTWADQMFLRGRQEGREEGRQEGRQEGVVLAMREGIRRVVRARFRSVPPALETALQAMTREEELAALFDRALKARTVDELV